MSTIVTLNGIPYLIPDSGEVGWGQEVTNYLKAIGSGGLLQLEGGSFTLLNDVNFGPNYGVSSPYFKSGQPSPAASGVVRLTNSESLTWRNTANTSDLSLYLVGDQLYFAGNPVGSGSGTSPLTNKGDLYTFTTEAARLPVGLNGQVLTADSSTSSGLSWATPTGGGGGGSGTVVGFTFVDGAGIAGTVTNSTTTPALALTLGAITPTSVVASGTVTASNLSGTHSGASSGTNTGDQTITLTGDVTGSGTGSFAVAYAGIVPVSLGGTGQTTANAAFNALAPSQATHAGEVLITDGTNTSWASFPGSGSVTSVSVNPTQGVTASVSNPTTIPTINIGLGAITPTSVVASGTVTGSNISGTASGTNTGDQTISLSGDVTGSGTSGISAVLSTTGVVAGSYTRANITVDAKGRITAAASEPAQTITLTGDVTGSGTGSFATSLAASGVTVGTYNNVTVNSKGLVTAGSNATYLTGNQTITVSGDATGSGTTGIALTLANTGVAVGTYTNATITVDSKGRVTGASSGSGGGGGGGSVTSVTGSSGTDISVSTVDSTTTPVISAVLNNTTVSAGSYTNANITIDSKGRITSAANGGGSVTSISVTSTSDVTGTVANPTTTPALSLNLTTTGVTAASYTKANITVDAKGRITAASSGSTGENYTSANPVNASLYSVAKYTLSSNLSITQPTSIPTGTSYTITYFITQAAALYSVTWGMTIKWKSGLTPTMTQINGYTDIFVLTTFDGGSTWFGTPIQAYN